MNVEAWCGHCGDGYRLSQLVTEGAGGRCPRCGFVYNHDYNAVVTQSAADFINAATQLEAAAERLADTAPQLHIDRAALYNALDKHLARDNK